MIEQHRVVRLRQVLGDVVAQHMLALQGSIDAALSEVPALRRVHDQPAAYPVVRRRLLASVQQRVKHFDLADEVRAFTISAADCETPAGLDLAQLQALDRWLEGIVDRLQHACDSPEAPPAR